MGSWFIQSVIATILLVPTYIAIGFFDKNFQVRPDVFLVWYFLGVSITSAFAGGSLSAVFPSWRLVMIILLIGLTFGATANIFLFRAVATAPNPGLPASVVNMASVGVFVSAVLLSRWAPSYFSSVKVDNWSLMGIFLVIAGASIIAIRR